MAKTDGVLPRVSLDASGADARREVNLPSGIGSVVVKSVTKGQVLALNALVAEDDGSPNLNDSRWDEGFFVYSIVEPEADEATRRGWFKNWRPDDVQAVIQAGLEVSGIIAGFPA